MPFGQGALGIVVKGGAGPKPEEGISRAAARDTWPFSLANPAPCRALPLYHLVKAKPLRGAARP